MKLFDVSWTDLAAAGTDSVVLIPTGAVEQHGPHLPFGTDTIIVTALAEAVEASATQQVLLTPSIWLGASAHHLGFGGTLSNSFEGYNASLLGVMRSLHQAGFWKFLILNGHGGNTSPNDVATRQFHANHPEVLIARRDYFSFWEAHEYERLTGPYPSIAHACELETSLMLHISPDRVKMDRAIDDGLHSPVKGTVHAFDTLTERGVLGYATQATAEKGRAFFDAAVNGIKEAIGVMHDGFQLRGPL